MPAVLVEPPDLELSEGLAVGDSVTTMVEPGVKLVMTDGETLVVAGLDFDVEVVGAIFVEAGVGVLVVVVVPLLLLLPPPELGTLASRPVR